MFNDQHILDLDSESSGGSLGDLSDVDTEVDDSLAPLPGPSNAPPLLPIGNPSPSLGVGPPSNDISSLFDGLVILEEHPAARPPAWGAAPVAPPPPLEPLLHGFDESGASSSLLDMDLSSPPFDPHPQAVWMGQEQHINLPHEEEREAVGEAVPFWDAPSAPPFEHSFDDDLSRSDRIDQSERRVLDASPLPKPPIDALSSEPDDQLEPVTVESEVVPSLGEAAVLPEEKQEVIDFQNDEHREILSDALEPTAEDKEEKSETQQEVAAAATAAPSMSEEERIEESIPSADDDEVPPEKEEEASGREVVSSEVEEGNAPNEGLAPGAKSPEAEDYAPVLETTRDIALHNQEEEEAVLQAPEEVDKSIEQPEVAVEETQQRTEDSSLLAASDEEMPPAEILEPLTEDEEESAVLLNQPAQSLDGEETEPTTVIAAQAQQRVEQIGEEMKEIEEQKENEEEEFLTPRPISAESKTQSKETTTPPAQQNTYPQRLRTESPYPDLPNASLLELAELAEARLASGAAASTSGAAPFSGGFSPFLGADNDAESQAFRKQLLVARLASQLEHAAQAEALSPVPSPGQASPSSPSSIGSSTALGSQLAARAFLSPQLEPVFKNSAGKAGIAGVHSVPSVIAKYLGIVAVGASAGAVHVLMPVTARGPPHLHVLEDRGIVGDGVTSLALGRHAGGLLLIAGHASGHLRLWETKPVSGGTGGGMTWVLARTVGGVHASVVTACAVMDGGQTTWALSADAHGRLVCHNVNRLLSVAAQAIAGFARQWAGGAGAASASTLITLQAAGQDPGIVLSLAPLLAPNAPPPQQHPSQQGQPQPQPQPKALYSTADGSHFVLVVATRAVLLCVLSSEGSLTILHIFFPPARTIENTPAGCAAWRLADPSSPTPGGQQHSSAGSRQPTHALAAVAWGTSVSIYDVALTRPRPASSLHSPRGGTASSTAGASTITASDAESSPRTAPAPLDPPRLLAVLPTGNLVTGVGFIGSGAIAVATADGEVETEITLWHPSTFPMDGSGAGGTASRSARQLEGYVDTLRLHDWMVVRELGMYGAPSLHGSLATGGDQLLLLTSRGVRVVHLLTWHQRLSTLVSQNKLEVALLCGARLYLGTQTTSAAAPAVKQAWPADTALPAEAEQVTRQLVTILQALVDSKIEDLNMLYHQLTQEPSVLNEKAEQLADIALNTCLLLSRSEALFDDIAPKFLSSPFSAAFLHQLEPRILADELPSLAPEVMQALVEHFAHSRQHDRVERCVIKLDILSLDLNQLIPLCLRHGLYGALVHIFNGALQDYQTPAALMLIAAAAAQQAETAQKPFPKPILEDTSTSAAELGGLHKRSSAAQALESSLSLRLGFRLLVYLRGCLAGMQYPPGSGTAPPLQQQAMRLHAATFLLHSTTNSLLETWRLWASVAHLDVPPTPNSSNQNAITAGTSALSFATTPSGITAMVNDGSLSNTLLRDPSPALRYLCEMDAEAVLCMLRDGLKGWDALESDLVELTPEIAPIVAAHPGRTVTQAAVDAVVGLLQEERTDFLSSKGGTGTVLRNDSAPGSNGGPRGSGAWEIPALRFVAEHLASNRAAAEGAVLMRVLRFLAQPTAGSSASHVPEAEREAIFRDVVAHAAEGDKNSEARAEALRLARSAGFRQAEARIQHSERAHSEALQCLVEDGLRHPLAPFRYLRDVVFDPGMSDAERAAIKTAALRLARELVRIDAGQTAATVAECFSQKTQIAVLEALAPWPDDQFAFLQAAVEGGRQQAGEVHVMEESGNGNGKFRSESPMDAFRDPLFAPLLNDKNVSSTYVRLLCRFQPSSVLAFLQSHDTYDVDACLKHCIDNGARAAAAFLLERRGDIRAALKIYLEEVHLANNALIAVVKQKGISGLPGNSLRTRPGSGGTPSDGLKTRERFTNKVVAVAQRRRGSSPSEEGFYTPPFEEYISARQVLRSAVSMCVRFAQDHLGPPGANAPQQQQQAANGGGTVGTPLIPSSASSSSFSGITTKALPSGASDNRNIGATDPVRAVWLEVLQRYLAVIKALREEMRTATKENGEPTPNPSNTLSNSATIHESNDSIDSSTAMERLSALESVFTSFLEEVIGQMAGHVPLQSIAAAVMEQYGGDAFGDFRTTLLSLLGVCNFELAILRCASRVTGTDTVSLLQEGYKKCMRPETVGGSSSSGVTNTVYSSDIARGVDAWSSANEGRKYGSGWWGSEGDLMSHAESSSSGMLLSLNSARQRGQEAWTKAAAAAGPAASTLLQRMSFPQGAA